MSIEDEMITAHKHGLRMFEIFLGDKERAALYVVERYHTEHEREAFTAGFRGATQRSQPELTTELDTVQLLRAVQYALNQVPNHGLRGCPHGFRNTYQLASAVDKQLRWFDELNRTLEAMAAYEERKQ
jgi:hypothetical protein